MPYVHMYSVPCLRTGVSAFTLVNVHVLKIN